MKLDNTYTDTDVEEIDDVELELEDDVNEQSGEVEEPKAKSNKSPAELKIVALKEENKRLKSEMATLKQGKQSNEQDALVDKYKKMGYDDDTARINAENEIQFSEIKNQLALQNFKEANHTVLNLYPKAKDNLAWLMNASKASGMSVDEICRGKWGNDPTTLEQRNKMSVTSVHDGGADGVGKAQRTATQQGSLELSADDAKRKAFYERLVGPLTVEEYFEEKNKRGK